MFIDQPSYHGGRGYLAFRTDDIASGNWQSVPSAQLPSSPRHGTVIPVTQAELDRMRAAYQPDLLISSVDDATVTTRQGIPPVLPATVSATVGRLALPGRGHLGRDRPGVVRRARARSRSAARSSAASADDPVATVTVTDAADPVVVLAAGSPAASTAGGSRTRSR